MSANQGRSKSMARRGFLMGAGLAGAAGAVAVARRTPPVAAQSNDAAAQLDARGGGGYHVTDHVRRYYRSTMV